MQTHLGNRTVGLVVAAFFILVTLSIFGNLISGLFSYILAAVSGGLAILAWKKNKERENPPLPGNSRNYPALSLRIENVVPGGVLRISEFGPDLVDLDLQVDERHLYDEQGFTWFELACDSRDGRYYVTFVDDDEVEISVCGPAHDLADLGLTEEDYAPTGKLPDEVVFEGTTYHRMEKGRAKFYKNSDRTQETQFRYWDYEPDRGKQSITIEQWPSGFEVHVSTSISYHQITVYANRGEE